ncbi:hypothetical protein J6TS7_04430 [Paenibacillus dendritiformis]|uniref:zinc dependent phospholipase C family protein n=1 Tax=Paenibacillus TaxID=44249 RepID=UPI001B2D612C|nr:zinc dependent phospholipase C family protein [Paenibacillus dendritiformis]MEB9893530.1 zinc dependent phospholipase C family protein [Bacillus cereus]GIO76833.1 hypothetical protein J6TS7_04430 [Paenibacillus dendritiformis]
MPNVWTHLLFGQEALAAAGLGRSIEEDRCRRLFNLGCQGPDFLFYHQFFPWQPASVMNELGSAMHNEHCGPFLADLIRAASPDLIAGEDSRLYALGFLLHHVLDRNMHPYVFSRSGFRKWDHQRFEVLMDTHVLREKRGIPSWKSPVWKEIHIGSILPADIIRHLSELSRTYYPKLAADVAPTSWNDAYRAMIRAQKLFHDPTGMKRRLAGKHLDPFVYRKVTPPYDVMNLARRPWLDPTGSGERYATTVWEMWDAARTDAAAALKAVKNYWHARRTEGADSGGTRQADAALTAAIGNRSYETGLPLDRNRAITVEDPIWDDAARR